MTAKRDQAASEAAQRRAGGLPDISHLVGKPSPPPADEESLPSLFDGEYEYDGPAYRVTGEAGRSRVEVERTDGPGWPD